MPELLFSLNDQFDDRAANAIRHYNASEHIGCEPLAPHGHVHIQIEGSSSRMHRISAHTAWSTVAFRRSFSDIRRDPSQLCVVNYIEQGAMRVHQGGKCHESPAGSFAIIPLGTPFNVECVPDHDCHRGLFMLHPLHEIQRYVPGLTASSPLTQNGNAMKIAGRLLDLLFWDGQAMDTRAFELMLDAMFTQIGRGASQTGVKRLSAHEQRFQEIESYLAKHFSKPGLSLKQVATDMGVSVRYVTNLFQRQGRSFERALWNLRLEKVREWLASRDMDDRTIAQIAFDAGFKSAPHLSRMFHQTYGVSPCEFRKQAKFS